MLFEALPAVGLRELRGLGHPGELDLHRAERARGRRAREALVLHAELGVSALGRLVVTRDRLAGALELFALVEGAEPEIRLLRAFGEIREPLLLLLAVALAGVLDVALALRLDALAAVVLLCSGAIRSLEERALVERGRRGSRWAVRLRVLVRVAQLPGDDRGACGSE